MRDIDFDTIDLMTKDQIASEIINRTKKPALVVFEEDDGEAYRCFHSFFSENDSRFHDVPGLLRRLADSFEGCDYHPGEDCAGGGKDAL